MIIKWLSDLSRHPEIHHAYVPDQQCLYGVSICHSKQLDKEPHFEWGTYTMYSTRPRLPPRKCKLCQKILEKGEATA